MQLTHPEALSFNPNPTISPDGRWIAFATGEGLWIRDLRKLEPTAVPDSKEADRTFWSPDSRWLAFSAGRRLLKFSIEGGSPVDVARLPDPLRSGGGGAWLPDGRIVFTTGDTGLLEVPDQGGDPRSILEPAEGEDDFHEATVLPGGRGVLFVVHRDEGTDTVEVFDGERRARILQMPGERLSNPVYSPTGHILFSRFSTIPGIWALGFSLDDLEPVGEPFLVIPGGRVPDVSQEGTLVYLSSGDSPETRFTWVDRNGQAMEEVLEPDRHTLGALSPDGRRLVYAAREDEQSDLWILDLERETRTRLTFEDESEFWPEWWPDGRHIVHAASDRRSGAEPRIHLRAADGTGADQDLGDGNVPVFTPDGNGIVFTRQGPDTGSDIWLLAPLDGEPVPLIQDKRGQFFARVSPDGRYLAYTSSESDRQEIYLTRFPVPEGKWQVSVDGGSLFRWSPDGSRLHYVRVESGEDMALMEVEVATEPAVTLGRPRKLFDLPRGSDRQFAPSGDGSRFLVALPGGDAEPDSALKIHVVQSWFEEFRRP